MNSILMLCLLAIAPAPAAASHPASARAATVAPAAAHAVLPFIEDDYDRALAAARAKRLPLFVDASAPWCHTCRSMKAFVLNDPSLARDAGRFVWLDINTEKASNAAFARKFPVRAIPTFFVVDPADEQVAVRWVGAMTVAQLHKLANSDPLASRAGTTFGSRLARADSLYGAGAYAAAAPAYEQVLAGAPAAWPAYGRVVEALLYSDSQADRTEATLTLARSALPRLHGTPSEAVAAASGLDGAISLPADHPGRAASIAEFETAARRVLADRTLDIAADDRSSLYGSLVDARSDANDTAGHQRVAAEWAAFLEHEAARARSPEQRAVFDPHRLSAYLELGEPARAIPMLDQSHREFPGDYNPLARLAMAYNAMKQWDKALAASTEAMTLAYGPRKLRIYDTRAQIQAGAGDSTAARATLVEAVRYAEALPEGQRSDRSIAAFRKELASYSEPNAVGAR